MGILFYDLGKEKNEKYMTLLEKYSQCKCKTHEEREEYISVLKNLLEEDIEFNAKLAVLNMLIIKIPLEGTNFSPIP